MSDAAALAEVHLLGLISEAHDPAYGPSRRDLDPRVRFEAALDAAIAVGLVAPERRRGWVERYERFGTGAAPPAADVRMEHAEELLDRLRAAADAERGEGVAHQIRLADAHEALAAVGALPTERPGWPDWLEPGGEDPEDWERPSLARVLAVLPGDLGPCADGACVVAVECFDGGIGLRWRMPSPGDGDADYFEPDFRLSDDAGTRYAPSSGGSCDSGDVVEGRSTFSPAVPPEARRLTVAWTGGELELDVAGVAERMPV